MMDLLLVTDVLRSRLAQPENLVINYMPYGRQDRATTAQQPFSLDIFARIIHLMNYKYILTYEPHSDVTGALFQNIIMMHCNREVRDYCKSLHIGLNKENLMLFAPDAGGSKRVDRVQEYLLSSRSGFYGAISPEYGQALKHRNPATGRLEITFISPNVRGKDVVIVDDICDGGATFVQLAPKLKEAGAKSLHLFVAHGIFSKGLNELRGYYETIATTDSYCEMKSEPHNGFSVYPLNYLTNQNWHGE